jgi:hypothetical protein
MFSADDDQTTGDEVIQLGATGFVSKTNLDRRTRFLSMLFAWTRGPLRWR